MGPTARSLVASIIDRIEGNVHDTMLFPGLLRRALVVCIAIARL
jgi:hypothetical protein